MRNIKIDMYYVYILFCQKDGKLYIGFTSDLKKRVLKHKSGFVLATKHRGPVRLIYYEAYLNEDDARQREKYLKGGKGHSELKIQLVHILGKLGYKYVNPRY